MWRVRGCGWQVRESPVCVEMCSAVRCGGGGKSPSRPARCVGSSQRAAMVLPCGAYHRHASGGCMVCVRVWYRCGSSLCCAWVALCSAQLIAHFLLSRSCPPFSPSAGAAMSFASAAAAPFAPADASFCFFRASSDALYAV